MARVADRQQGPGRERRLEFFDRATERQRLRQLARQGEAGRAKRAWDRADLYARTGA
jgi:hypothetical protein